MVWKSNSIKTTPHLLLSLLLITLMIFLAACGADEGAEVPVEEAPDAVVVVEEAEPEMVEEEGIEIPEGTPEIAAEEMLEATSLVEEEPLAEIPEGTPEIAAEEMLEATSLIEEEPLAEIPEGTPEIAAEEMLEATSLIEEEPLAEIPEGTPEIAAEEMLEATPLVSEEAVAEANEPLGTEALGAPALRATTMLDYPVVNPGGEGLGEVEDLMISLDTGQVQYAVLTFGGFFGTERDLYPIPVEMLAIDPEAGALELDVDLGILEDAPSFQADSWVDASVPDWDTEPREYWEQQGQVVGAEAEQAALSVEGGEAEGTAIRATTLLDYDVMSQAGEAVGQVEDFMIGLEDGQIQYLALSWDDRLDKGTDQMLYAVPLQALTLDLEAETLIFSGNEEVLFNSPGFEFGNWPNTINRNWDLAIREYWQNYPETLEQEGSQIDQAAEEEAGLAQPEAEEMTLAESVAAGIVSDEADARATTLLDYDLHNSAGEALGEIEDVLVGLESGQVKYALLSFGGGFLDLGEDLFVVPIDALNLDSAQGVAIFDATEETLADAPAFGVNEWPNTLEPGWDESIQDFWAVTLPVMRDEAAQETPGLSSTIMVEPMMRATELLGHDVVNLNLEGIGEIDDLLIGLESNQVKYAVVGFGGFLDIGEKLFAVPISAFEHDSLRGRMILDISEEVLEDAPGFDPDNWPDTANPQWDVDSSAYWELVGFLPPVPTSPVGLGAPLNELALRASNLLDYPVMTFEGEEIGQVEDLIVAYPSGQLTYAVVSFNELAGTENMLYPIPLNVMFLDLAQNGLLLDQLDQETLIEAPSFAPDDWPAMIEAGWDDALREYWITSALIIEPGLRVSQLTDYSVMGLEGQMMGQMEDLLIGVTSNQVNYAVLAPEFAGADTRALYPIPFNLFRVDFDDEVALLTLPEAVLLDAPRFEAGEWPDTLQPAWDNLYLEYWGVGVAPTATSVQTTPIIDEAGVRATGLLDYDVETPLGEDLGEIEDLMINLEDGWVSYVILEMDSTLWQEGKLFPVPLTALALDPLDDAYILDVDEETMENLPGFEAADWPHTADPAWSQIYSDFWEEIPAPETTTAPHPIGDAILENVAIRATALLDTDVENFQDEELGEIEDLVIGLDTGRVNYAVLSFEEGIFDLDEKLFAVPLSSLAIVETNDEVLFDVDRATLENAIGFDPNNWPDMANPRWDVGVRDYWQDQ